MNEAVFEQVIERAINGDGRGPTARRAGEPVEHVIGAQRPARLAQKVENGAPARRQIQPGHMGPMAFAMRMSMALILGAPMVMRPRTGRA